MKDSHDKKAPENMDPIAHAAAFVSSFIVPDKRARYLEFLARPKHRHKFLERLNQFLELIPEHATPVKNPVTSELKRLLRAKGAGAMAHFIADSTELDGLELPLVEALDSALSDQFGSIVSCIPGRLAFYKPEAPGGAFILERSSRS